MAKHESDPSERPTTRDARGPLRLARIPGRSAGTIVLVAAAWAVAQPAMAQRWTVLPVVRDSRVPEEERRAAGEAIRESGALGPEAHALSEAELAGRAGELASCTEVDCAARLARQADLDFVAVVAVWPGDGTRTVAVSLVEPNGLVYEADRPVDDDLRAAAVAALVEATNELRRGGGVELTVHSTPSGALVRVDGVEVGVTPYRGTHPPGTHEVEVSLRGETERREIAFEAEPIALDIALGDGGGGIDGPAEAPSGGSAASWIVAGGLAAAGAALLVSPVLTLARDGDEVDQTASMREVVHFGTRSWILLAAGVALIGGATVVALTQPFSVEAGPDHAAFTFTGTF